MPRFVLLEHDHPHLHWDLMLEAGEALWSWRLDAPPEASKTPIRAARTPDHRLLYLSYEGPVSGDRGSVRRHDHGLFHWIETGETLCVRLEGLHLRGTLRLIHEDAEKWQAFYEPDPAS